MDMNLRDWLIVIGVLVIIGILADGYRRVRNARRNAQMMDFYSISDEHDENNPELPNGGARVIRRCEPDFDYEEPDNSATSKKASVAIEPTFSAAESEPPESEPVESLEASVERQAEPVESKPAVETEPVKANPEVSKAEPVTEAKPIPERRRRKPFARVEPKTAAQEEQLADRPPAEEVVVINVVAAKGAPYKGDLLLQNLLDSGMKYGEMGIFHCHEKPNGGGKIMFSVANGVEPGNFNFDTLDSIHTPAVSFFMGLPGPTQPLRAFEHLLQAVHHLVAELGGELHDENHSIMSQQTLEHCRQRIREFERRQLTHKQPAL